MNAAEALKKTVIVAPDVQDHRWGKGILIWLVSIVQAKLRYIIFTTANTLSLDNTYITLSSRIFHMFHVI